MEKEENEYPESHLTKIIIGLAFKTQNDVGRGFAEKIYQKVFENYLKENGIKYKRENFCDIVINKERVGSFFLDFLIENKVVVELKARDTIYQKDISQVLNYLKINNLKIGLIIYFTNSGVKIKRLIN